jgi:hypothetical protein
VRRVQLYIRQFRRFEALWTGVIDEHGQRHGKFLSCQDSRMIRKASLPDAVNELVDRPAAGILSLASIPGRALAVRVKRNGPL